MTFIIILSIAFLIVCGISLYLLYTKNQILKELEDSKNNVQETKEKLIEYVERPIKDKFEILPGELGFELIDQQIIVMNETDCYFQTMVSDDQIPYLWNNKGEKHIKTSVYPVKVPNALKNIIQQRLLKDNVIAKADYDIFLKKNNIKIEFFHQQSKNGKQESLMNIINMNNEIYERVKQSAIAYVTKIQNFNDDILKLESTRKTLLAKIESIDPEERLTKIALEGALKNVETNIEMQYAKTIRNTTDGPDNKLVKIKLNTLDNHGLTDAEFFDIEQEKQRAFWEHGETLSKEIDEYNNLTKYENSKIFANITNEGK